MKAPFAALRSSGRAVFALAALIGPWVVIGTEALAQAPAPAVLVQAAELKSVTRQNEFVGRVEAVEKVDLRARVSGFLGPRKYADGDRVKAGQVLFEIEPEAFQALVDQRQAQLESAQAALENAELQLQRGKELGRTNAIAQSQIDQRVADQARAAAAVKEAEAGLTDARIKLSYTKVLSPIDGRIGRPVVTPGNLVGPETGVLATVVRDDEVNVLFAVSQREILDARRRGVDAGQIKVRLKLADGQLYEDIGRITFIDVTVDARTDGQILRASFPNAKRLLSDGQTVRLILEQESETPSVVVPQAAVAVDQAGSYVLVVTPANVVELRRVKSGVQRDGSTAIDAGLKPGELVIVQGQQRARPGQSVVAQPITR